MSSSSFLSSRSPGTGGRTMLKYTVQAAPVWPFRSEEMETAERREAMLARQHRSSAPCEGVEPGN